MHFIHRNFSCHQCTSEKKTNYIMSFLQLEIIISESIERLFTNYTSLYNISPRHPNATQKLLARASVTDMT